MVTLAAMLKIYFELFLQNQKGNWLKLHWSIEVTCSSKELKLFWLEIQDGRHLENQYFSWMERPTDLNLSGNQVSDTGPSWHPGLQQVLGFTKCYPKKMSALSLIYLPLISFFPPLFYFVPAREHIITNNWWLFIRCLDGHNFWVLDHSTMTSWHMKIAFPIVHTIMSRIYWNKT